MRPILVVAPEMRCYQIGESWYFTADLVDAELAQAVDEPSAATLTVTHAGDGSLLGPVSMTIDGSTVSYTMAAGLVTTPERALKASLALTLGGESYTLLHLFDAVRFSPRMTVTPADLVRHAGQAAALAVQGDARNAGILRSAWEDVLEFVGNLAGYPDGVIDPQSLGRGHLFRTLELLYGRAVLEDRGGMDVQRQRWAGEWKDWKERAHLRIDADSSGTLDPSESPRSPSSVSFGRRVIS